MAKVELANNKFAKYVIIKFKKVLTLTLCHSVL